MKNAWIALKKSLYLYYNLKREKMKKEQLISQLEGAKALTSVVSIDNVIALIQQFEPEQVESKTFLLNEKSFDTVMDIVEKSVNSLRTRDIVDFDDAEFELNYNNTIELTDVRVDTVCIINDIREALEMIFEETADEDEEDVPAATDRFIEDQIEAEEADAVQQEQAEE